MTSITAVALAVAVTAGWTVDAETDQEAIAALKVAAGRGDAEVVQAKAQGLEPELLDPIAQRATCAGQPASVRVLIAAGARPKEFGPLGLDCLLAPGTRYTRREIPSPAEQARWIQLVALLVDHGLAPGPLLAPALRICATSLAGALLDKGAAVSGQAGDEPPPLVLAAGCPGDLVERFLAKGASPKASPGVRTALHALVLGRGEPAAFAARLSTLLKAGADIDARDAWGATPLALACGLIYSEAYEESDVYPSGERRDDYTRALLAAGADPNLPDKDGVGPLQRLLADGDQPCAALAEPGDHHGGENAADRERRLQRACDTQKAVLSRLLAAGANPRAEDPRGYSPLYAAAYSGCLPCLELLKAHGVGPDTPDKAGRTLLHRIAADKNRSGTEERAVTALLKAGARLDVKDATGRTPYELARSAGRLPLLGHLLAPPAQPLSAAVLRVTASSTLVEKGRAADRYVPAKAVDGSLATCWCKGTKGHGEGEWLQIELAKPSRVRAVRVYPGCGATDAIWYSNNRISELEVALGKASAPASLANERRLQDLGFSSDLPVTSLRFTIRGVHSYPPPKFDDTCLGEIQADLE